MNTWTTAARRTLEVELERVRRLAIESGADPDEVLDDLRRHVDEEARVSGLGVVTEDDVRRLMARVSPVWAVHEAPNRTTPGSSAERKAGSASVRTLGSAECVLAFFGVMLPAITVIVEVFSRICAREILDPMPTIWHGVLLAGVPVLNAVALWFIALRNPGKGSGQPGMNERFLRRLWVGNGIAVGVSSAYAILFLPLTPLAAIGILLGVGLLALAPLAALISGLVLRSRLNQASMDRRPLSRSAWWAGFGSAWAVLLLLIAPVLVTQHWMRLAVLAGDPEIETGGDRREAVIRLREWGSHDTLLRACYARRRGLWEQMFADQVPTDQARELYYRVTGKSFNAVPPPSAALGRANRTLTEEFATGGEEWDTALGGETVSGRVRGLSLQESRFDALANADEGWGYVEWTLEFRNDHERLPREARAQILLPPGAVVSRLTLWIQGEEREAAFAGRAEVRAAYQKVAVVQQRDPVLVTTCGPDRVLMQCFPIVAGGGTMRVRLGITVPLEMRNPSEAVLVWPRILERNFGFSRDLEHAVWLESPQSPKATEGWSPLTDARGRTGWRAGWDEAQWMDVRRNLVLNRDPAVTEVVAPDRRGDAGAWVRQRWVKDEAPAPRRVALVLDGSAGMDPFYREVADALEGMPASIELGVFFAQDGVRRMFEDRNGARAAESVRRMEGEGGQDNVRALVQAWEWAAAQPLGTVLWVHGPQAMVLEPVGALKQRLQWRDDGSGPALHELQVRLGPDRLVESLDSVAAVQRLPRLGTVREDLEGVFEVWAGRESRWQWVREHGTQPPLAADGAHASSHVARLWAAGEVRRLLRERRVTEAVALGAAHQLVTRATGAVVLETKQQYTDAGLQPVDPLTVPVVPEPGAGALLALGMTVLLLRRRFNRRQVRPACRLSQSPPR